MKNDKQLAKFLQYVLARRPDEFGLVPDADGYIKVKEVIKVLHEEKWHQVRPEHLATLPYRLPASGFELDHNHIRACKRDRMPLISKGATAPKQLFACIRRKAYAAVRENGLHPQTHPDRVLLYAKQTLARRVGQRRDPTPVIVTVQTTVAERTGIVFERFGEEVFLAPHIPMNCCRLPAAPKPVQAEKSAGDSATVSPPQPAGSFTLDWERLAKSAPPPKPSGRKSKQWRRARERLRRMKQSSGDSS
jgi:putative RNA 2'-phosphotransferase